MCHNKEFKGFNAASEFFQDYHQKMKNCKEFNQKSAQDSGMKIHICRSYGDDGESKDQIVLDGSEEH